MLVKIFGPGRHETCLRETFLYNAHHRGQYFCNDKTVKVTNQGIRFNFGHTRAYATILATIVRLEGFGKEASVKIQLLTLDLFSCLWETLTGHMGMSFLQGINDCLIPVRMLDQFTL